jgi:hypothetical protein
MVRKSIAKKRTSVTKKRGSAKKTAEKYVIHPLLLTGTGEKHNYNLSQYTQYHVSTIEYLVDEKRYRARIGFTGNDGYVFFNSNHEDFSDAEHTINFVKDGKSSGKLYNIFAETIAVNTSPTLGKVTEVHSLIYSFVIE